MTASSAGSMFGDQRSAAERPPQVNVMPPKTSKLRLSQSGGWKSAYKRPGSRAVSLNELRLQGTIACLLQLVITIMFPGIWYSLFYSRDSRLTPIPILTWAITAVVGCLGIAGFVLLKSLALGCHAVLGLALAAGLGVFHTQVYTTMADRCDQVQSSFSGCSSCACAATNDCTRAALEAATCLECKAWATDVCSEASGFLPYMGLVQLLFISLPTVFSFMVLMRLEKANSDLANRLLYARAVVIREVERVEAGQGLGVNPMVLQQMMTTMLRHGGKADRGTVRHGCEILHMDEQALEVEWLDVEVRGPNSRPSMVAGPPAPADPIVVPAKGSILLPVLAATAPVTAPGLLGSASVPLDVKPAFEPTGTLREASQASSARQRAFLWEKLELNSASDSDSNPGGSGRRRTGVTEPGAMPREPMLLPAGDRQRGFGPGTGNSDEYDGTVTLTDGVTDVDTDAATSPEAAGGKKKKKTGRKKKAGAETAGDDTEGGDEAGKKKKKKKKKSSGIGLEEGAKGEEGGGGNKGKKKKKKVKDKAPGGEGDDTELVLTEVGDEDVSGAETDTRSRGPSRGAKVPMPAPMPVPVPMPVPAPVPVPVSAERRSQVAMTVAVPEPEREKSPPVLMMRGSDVSSDMRLELGGPSMTSPTGLIRHFKTPRSLKKSRTGQHNH